MSEEEEQKSEIERLAEEIVTFMRKYSALKDTNKKFKEDLVKLRRITDKRIEYLRNELHNEQQLVSDAIVAQENKRREILDLKTENARLKSIVCNAQATLKELGHYIDMSSCQVLKLVKCPSIHVTVTKTEDSPEAMAGKCYSEEGDVVSNA